MSHDSVATENLDKHGDKCNCFTVLLFFSTDQNCGLGIKKKKNS